MDFVIIRTLLLGKVIKLTFCYFKEASRKQGNKERQKKKIGMKGKIEKRNFEINY